MPRMPEHKGQGMVFQLPANEAAQFGVWHPRAAELGPAMSEHFAGGWPGGGAMGRVGSSMGAKLGGTVHPVMGVAWAVGVTVAGEPAG